MLKRVGALVLAFAVAVAIAAWIYNARANEKVGTGSEAGKTGSSSLATFTPAARRVAYKFIATAVARKDPAAWRLIDPEFPCIEGGMKEAWQSGQVWIVPLRHVRPDDVVLTVSKRLPESIWLDVLIQQPRQFALRMELKRRGRDHWLVRYWDKIWSPITGLCE